MRIDSHQHFLELRCREYPWINDGAKVLRHDFLPVNLEPSCAKVKLDGSVAVQARQTVEESRWLLKPGRSLSFDQRVVGWVDLRSPRVEEQLAELSRHPKFVGVRHVVQDEPDVDFNAAPELSERHRKTEPVSVGLRFIDFPEATSPQSRW